jgi:CheY-like chemotaxis protein
MKKNELGHLLCVDDSAEDRLLISLAAKEAGIPNPLIMLEDGEEAVEYLSRKGRFSDPAASPSPAMLLLDLKMPRLSGIEVLTWVRSQEHLKALPIIVFSASIHPGEITEAYRLGVNSFMVKPASAQEMVDMMSAIKSYWLRYNWFPEREEAFETAGTAKAKRPLDPLGTLP